jgi:hypothetical protein
MVWNLATRRHLSEGEIDTAWARGQVMTLKEVVTYARRASAAGAEAT